MLSLTALKTKNPINSFVYEKLLCQLKTNESSIFDFNTRIEKAKLSCWKYNVVNNQYPQQNGHQ